jgi:ferredoxin/flavodoxin
MSVVIYYFTGTGNSLFVAKDIAEKLGAELIPIASAVRQEAVRTDADVIGIVTPVYYGELPVIIKDFAQKLDNVGGKYIFAVCTFGGSAGYSLKILRSIIESGGGELSATCGVHMPQNSFSKPWEKNSILYAGWKKKVNRFVGKVNKRTKGHFFRNYLHVAIFMPIDYIVKRMKPQYRKSFAERSGASDELSTDELIRLNDARHKVNDKCTGCGICAKICPVDNIEMRDGSPVWLHNCENCLACYNWCPVRAIEGTIAAEGYFYRHPDIGVTEIMAQKKDG